MSAHLIVSKEKMNKIKAELKKILPNDTCFVLMICEGNKDQPLAQFVSNTDKHGARNMAEGFIKTLDRGGFINTPNSN